MTLDEAKQEIPTFDSFADKFCNHCFNDIICNMDCKVMQKAEKMFDRVQQAYARHDGDIVKIDRYIKMQRSENMDKKDLSQNCDFDDDSDKNDCWHCIHFLFPIGCMYGEDDDEKDEISITTRR